MSENESHRKQRQSHLRWIRIGDLKPHPQAQRKFRAQRAEELAATFNIESMGFVVVSKHDSQMFVIDGQHRVAALRLIGFAEDDVIQCELYEGLTFDEDAELFLTRNHVLSVKAMDRYKVGLVAGRKNESAIDQCVRSQGLKVGDNGIQAVSALMDAYRRTGDEGLAKVLRIIRDAYGETGFESMIIQGTALAIQRFNGKIDEDQMVQALTNAHGGLNGLLNTAAKTRETLGQSKAQCVAATEVGFYNRVPGKRLPSWWKDA